jgi:hypothetical protein
MANDRGPVWKNEQERQILAEVYRSFATSFDSNRNPTSYQEWFRGAGIVDNHPVKMTKTLVINCNYRPLLMMKEVLGLAEKYGLALFLQEVNSNGNPKE